MTAEDIRHETRKRKMTRLCHYTPSRNLVHITTRGDGLLSTAQLNAEERKSFHQQDLGRLDGYPDHICCSIEFPNGWYFRQRRLDPRGQIKLFTDWVIFFIDPCCLWRPEALFCPRNAAAERGRLCSPGIEAFRGLYASEIEGAYGKTYRRTPDRGAAAPTDDQAEVLIHRQIEKEAVLGIAVKDKSQAKREVARLDQLAVSPTAFRFIIAPTYFGPPKKLSGMIAAGERPLEEEWDPES